MENHASEVPTLGGGTPNQFRELNQAEDLSDSGDDRSLPSTGHRSQSKKRCCPLGSAAAGALAGVGLWGVGVLCVLCYVFVFRTADVATPAPVGAAIAPMVVAKAVPPAMIAAAAPPATQPPAQAGTPYSAKTAATIVPAAHADAAIATAGKTQQGATTSVSDAGPAADSTAPDGFFRAKFAWKYDTTKCLDVQGNQARNGATIQIFDCWDDKTGGQDFLIPVSGKGQIRWASHPSKCLDVTGQKSIDGTPIQLWDCDASGTHHDFYAPSYSEPSAVIKWARDPRKCLDVFAQKATNGNKVTLWECDAAHTHHSFALMTPHKAG